VGIEVFVDPLFDGSSKGVGLAVGRSMFYMVKIYCYDKADKQVLPSSSTPASFV
jgi:hypothetical protein